MSREVVEQEAPWREDEQPINVSVGRHDDVLVDNLQSEMEEYKKISWSAKYYINALLLKYCVYQYMEQNKGDKHVLEIRSACGIPVDYGKVDTVLTDATVIYSIDNKLIQYESYANNVSLKSNHDISDLRSKIDEFIAKKNPLFNKCSHFFMDPNAGIMYDLKKPNDIGYSNVIVDPEIKEDIYDNTICNLEELAYNNGIILHGKPGCGKTVLCSVLMAEANRKGFSSAFTTDAIALEVIAEAVEIYMGSTFLVIEDLDSIAPDRKESSVPISKFLQFMNGIQEQSKRLVVVATTNYIEWLDDAVKNRPMRFNRKYEIKLPDNEQILQLVTLYFDANISEQFGHYFFDKKFTGSHITEVKRTYELERAKMKRDEVIEYDEGTLVKKCVGIVNQHFAIMSKGPGF